MPPLIVLALLAAAPPVPGVPAPLGRFGDLVTEPPERGHRASELVVVGTPPRCDAPHAAWLSRAVVGTVRAGEQLVQYLEAYPQAAEAAFGKGTRPLAQVAEALAAANDALPSGVATCGEVKGPWRLPASGGARAQCATPLQWGKGGQVDFLDAKSGRLAARVRFFPADASTADGCRPRFSVALFDARGKPRVVVHADFGGAPLEVTLLGLRTQHWRWDAASQYFMPSLR